MARVKILLAVLCQEFLHLVDILDMMGKGEELTPLLRVESFAYVRTGKDGKQIVEPATGKPYCDRKKDFQYKIDKGDLCYRLFIKHGFTWGGSWRTMKDYQHFEFHP